MSTDTPVSHAVTSLTTTPKWYVTLIGALSVIRRWWVSCCWDSLMSSIACKKPNICLASSEESLWSNCRKPRLKTAQLLPCQTPPLTVGRMQLNWHTRHNSWRHNSWPCLFGVQVVGTISEHEGRIILCKRAIEPCRGQWTLPAGTSNRYAAPSDIQNQPRFCYRWDDKDFAILIFASFITPVTFRSYLFSWTLPVREYESILKGNVQQIAIRAASNRQIGLALNAVNGQIEDSRKDQWRFESILDICEVLTCQAGIDLCHEHSIGYMEMSESSAEGAVRETLEEAGANVQVSPL